MMIRLVSAARIAEIAARIAALPQGWYVRLGGWRRFLWVSLGALLVTGLAIATQPAQAYQVDIVPASPQLGDTISVIVHADASPGTANPQVTVLGKTYQTFPLSGNRYRALVPTSPLDQPGRLMIQVTGSEETRNIALDLRNRSFPTQRITLSPGRAGLEGTDYEFQRLDDFKALVTPEKLWNGTLLRPSDGRVSSEYGIRRYYNGEFAQDYYHRGVDYAAPTGSPIVAPAGGRVVVVGRVEDGFTLNGNTIALDHGQGVGSIFIHLSRIDVREGDLVQPGQLIGAIGSTGFATGPNLHWGLYVNGVAVDPVPWRYDGIE